MTKAEFLALLEASKLVGADISVTAGTPNPGSRDGFYIIIRKGLVNKVLFAGLDKTTMTMIYERIS